MQPRVLILGATGMLGFAVHRRLADSGWQVAGTVRGAQLPDHPFCTGLEFLTGIDATRVVTVEQAIDEYQPDVIVNATGVKRHSGEDGLLAMIAVNAVFPKRLGHIAAQRGIQLVQFSTDAVFDGETGGYSEGSLPNPTSPYAISKYLGEPDEHGVLTIRTSMVGRSLTADDGLVDWLLASAGSTVRGYSRAIFSGLPVTEIAGILAERVLARPSPLTGILHLAAEPIDKLSLLRLVAQRFDLTVTIEPDDSVAIDRTLVTLRGEDLNAYQSPSWPELIEAMHSFYSRLEQHLRPVRPGRL